LSITAVIILGNNQNGDRFDIYIIFSSKSLVQTKNILSSSQIIALCYPPFQFSGRLVRMRDPLRVRVPLRTENELLSQHWLHRISPYGNYCSCSSPRL